MDFLHKIEKGLTPNPDLACNSEIKFKELMNRALSERIGADYLATGSRKLPLHLHSPGHYARIGWKKESGKDDQTLLLTSKDEVKDQTYFLASISHLALARTMFPLGDMLKTVHLYNSSQ
jgi:tRNA-specific 2-thiouridylase